MIYAKRIKELRIEKGLTQKKLADFLQISQSVLCNYENGKSEPTANVIVRLCTFFQVSADYLLGLENEDGTKNYNFQGSTINHSTINFK